MYTKIAYPGSVESVTGMHMPENLDQLLESQRIKAHLKVVQHPNPLCRSFHVVREIAADNHYFGHGSRFGGNPFAVDPGDLAKGLAKRLEAVLGVDEGSLQPLEISITIGKAFSWKDVGPYVIGEIVKTLYPETIGSTLDISTRLGWSYHVRPRSFGGYFDDDDDGHRIEYQDMVDHEPIEVRFDGNRPVLDIEHLLGKEALKEAKNKKAESNEN